MKLRISCWLAVNALVLGLALCGTLACGDDDDDAGGDTDTDGDTDSNTGECSAVAWGSGLNNGEAVSNWIQFGYIDSDLDGFVEQEEVQFDLELIHCTGKESMVIVYGDTS
jgi:hypothetical protein